MRVFLFQKGSVVFFGMEFFLRIAENREKWAWRAMGSVPAVLLL